MGGRKEEEEEEKKEEDWEDPVVDADVSANVSADVGRSMPSTPSIFSVENCKKERKNSFPALCIPSHALKRNEKREIKKQKLLLVIDRLTQMLFLGRLSADSSWNDCWDIRNQRWRRRRRRRRRSGKCRLCSSTLLWCHRNSSLNDSMDFLPLLLHLLLSTPFRPPPFTPFRPLNYDYFSRLCVCV